MGRGGGVGVGWQGRVVTGFLCVTAGCPEASFADEAPTHSDLPVHTPPSPGTRWRGSENMSFLISFSTALLEVKYY